MVSNNNDDDDDDDDDDDHDIIGRRLTEVTTDPRETVFLFQRLSVAVQRFNAACLADTFPISESAP